MKNVQCNLKVLKIDFFRYFFAAFRKYQNFLQRFNLVIYFEENCCFIRAIIINTIYLSKRSFCFRIRAEKWRKIKELARTLCFS